MCVCVYVGGGGGTTHRKYETEICHFLNFSQIYLGLTGARVCVCEREREYTIHTTARVIFLSVGNH